MYQRILKRLGSGLRNLQTRAAFYSARTSHQTNGNAPFVRIDKGHNFPVVHVDTLLAAKMSGQAIHMPETYTEILGHRLSVPSSNSEERKIYERRTFRAPEMTIDRIQNYYWFPEIGFLISKAGGVWKHSTLGIYADPHFSMTRAVEKLTNPSGAADYVFHERLVQSAPTIEGVHLITSHYPSHNFGHFMLDMVPLIEFGTLRRLPMLTKPLLAWQKQIYCAMGVDLSGVREMAEPVYFLADVIVSNRHNAASTHAASPHLREVFARILKRVRQSGVTESRGGKLFVSRDGLKKRQITNGRSIRVELEKRGFQAAAPELNSFEQQASIFSNADIIVTEFGAAMANVVFCRPGTKIVEIIPEDQNDPWSAHLCASLGLEHITLFHKVRDQDRKSVEIGGQNYFNIHFNYQVDVDLVCKVVDSL